VQLSLIVATMRRDVMAVLVMLMDALIDCSFLFLVMMVVVMMSW